MPAIRTKISIVPCLQTIFKLSVYLTTISASHYRHSMSKDHGFNTFPLVQEQKETIRWQHPPPASKTSRSIPQDQNCPIRNEFDVKAAGMLCVRKCSVDKDCTNERKLCLCDGLCGLSCIRPEKECPELPDPEQGQVQLDGRHFQVSSTVYILSLVLSLVFSQQDIWTM